MSNDHTPPSATNAHAIQEVSPKESTMLGFEFAWDLGFTIAIPAVVFGIAGGYLDKQYGQSHWFLFIGLILAFAASSLSVYRKIDMILRRMPKDLPRKKKEPIDADIVKEQDELHELFRPPSE